MPGAWLLHTTADAVECFKSNKTLATSDAVSQLALLALAACESLRRPSRARAERIADCTLAQNGFYPLCARVQLTGEITAYWTPVQRGWAVARYSQPRCASSMPFAALSAKARPSRFGSGEGSPGSLELPSRILPFRQSHFSKQREPQLKARLDSQRTQE